AGELDVAQLAFSSFGAAIENAHMQDLRLIANELEDGVPGYATTHFMVLKDSPIKTIDSQRQGRRHQRHRQRPRYRDALRPQAASHGREARLHRCRDKLPQYAAGS